MRYRRILLTGSTGQIGFELRQRLPLLGELVAVDRTGLDLADASAIRGLVRELRPDLIVNAGAYTAVDRAEVEQPLARAVNAVAPAVLAEEARSAGALLVHYSTDYVFDGNGTEPYREDHPTSPINVYGATKLEGEQAAIASGCAAIVLRTSWVYALRGRNFVLTMRRLAAEREEIRVVDDQVGVPNWSAELAAATAVLLDRPRDALTADSGIYHLTAGGRTTWFGFARAILGGRGSARLVPITTEEYPTPAKRPRFSVLDGSRVASVFGVRLPGWERSLADCLASEAGSVAALNAGQGPFGPSGQDRERGQLDPGAVA